MIDLSKYADIVGGDWHTKHTPGYRNPKGAGKIPGVRAGAYFYATSELFTDIPSGAKSYNPQTNEFDIDDPSRLAATHYFDEHDGSDNQEFQERSSVYKKKIVATFDLLADAPRLVEELRETRERLLYDGHTHRCHQRLGDCVCHKKEFLQEVKLLVERESK